MNKSRQLEDLDRDALLHTTRHLLAEADALSSRISALNEIGLAVNQTFDLERIERVIAKQAKWLLDFHHCSVCLLKDDAWIINTLFGSVEPDQLDRDSMPNLASVMNTTRPLIVREGAASAFLLGYPSQIIIPLTADGVFVGTINFAAKEPALYSQDDMRIAYMLSLQLASAIRNASIVAELEKTQAELKLRVAELDAYGHTIAHDLKSPLSSILLRSQIIGRRHAEQGPEATVNDVAKVETSVQIMLRMIERLLMLARLRSDESLNERVVVQDAARAAIERFGPDIEARSIDVEVCELPDARGQAQWIEEIFANLISNAIKYMGDDNPSPRIHISADVQDTWVRYNVRDSGIGIQPEDRDRVFEMFTRAHDTHGIEGLGLGLSIVKRAVQRLGGQVGVESIVGQGACFWFTLVTASGSPTESP